jgi:hypothetical protein
VSLVVKTKTKTKQKISARIDLAALFCFFWQIFLQNQKYVIIKNVVGWLKAYGK